MHAYTYIYKSIFISFMCTHNKISHIHVYIATMHILSLRDITRFKHAAMIIIQMQVTIDNSNKH